MRLRSDEDYPIAWCQIHKSGYALLVQQILLPMCDDLRVCSNRLPENTPESITQARGASSSSVSWICGTNSGEYNSHCSVDTTPKGKSTNAIRSKLRMASSVKRLTFARPRSRLGRANKSPHRLLSPVPKACFICDSMKLLLAGFPLYQTSISTKNRPSGTAHRLI